MAGHRKLRGIVHNFLGRYTSRHSDYRGYWLFGFLSNEPAVFEFDLLGPGSGEVGPLAKAQNLALELFSEQMEKGAGPAAELTRARLALSVGAQESVQPVGTVLRRGRQITFAVTVAAGRASYEASRVVFVAHHDPAAETRS
jgi:hypothetical protein